MLQFAARLGGGERLDVRVIAARHAHLRAPSRGRAVDDSIARLEASNKRMKGLGRCDGGRRRCIARRAACTCRAARRG